MARYASLCYLSNALINKGGNPAADVVVTAPILKLFDE